MKMLYIPLWICTTYVRWHNRTVMPPHKGHTTTYCFFGTKLCFFDNIWPASVFCSHRIWNIRRRQRHQSGFFRCWCLFRCRSFGALTCVRAHLIFVILIAATVVYWKHPKDIPNFEFIPRTMYTRGIPLYSMVATSSLLNRWQVFTHALRIVFITNSTSLGWDSHKRKIKSTRAIAHFTTTLSEISFQMHHNYIPHQPLIFCPSRSSRSFGRWHVRPPPTSRWSSSCACSRRAFWWKRAVTRPLPPPSPAAADRAAPFAAAASRSAGTWFTCRAWFSAVTSASRTSWPMWTIGRLRWESHRGGLIVYSGCSSGLAGGVNGYLMWYLSCQILMNTHFHALNNYISYYLSKCHACLNILLWPCTNIQLMMYIPKTRPFRPLHLATLFVTQCFA